MSNDHDDINQYTAEDIRRYLSGNMLPAEMHAMEKAALDDPFLADAIDGMSMAMEQKGEEQTMRGLQDLNAEFSERTGSPAVPLRYIGWWKVAAAVIVLVGGSIWSYDVFVGSAQRAYAKNQEAVPATAPGRADSVAAGSAIVPIPDSTVALQRPDQSVANDWRRDQNAKAATLSQDDRAVTDLRQKDLAVAEENGNAASTRQAQEKKDELAKEELRSTAQAEEKREEHAKVQRSLVANDQTAHRYQQLDSVAPKKIENESSPVFAPPVANNDRDKYAEPAPGLRVQKNESAARNNLPSEIPRQNNVLAATNSFNGRVLDQNNKPIFGATVNVPTSNLQVLTDAEGKFKVPAPDSALTVSASAVGYQSQQFRIGPDPTSNQLRLQPSSSSLNEVVVTGYGSRKKSQPPKVMVQDAQPVNGWDQYQQYIDSSKKMPTANPGLTGDVVLSFTVDRTGIPQNIKVEQSLGKGYDEEARRLVQEGPRWKLLKGRKTKATVIIHF